MFFRRLSVMWIVLCALGLILLVSGLLGRFAYSHYREATRARDANESHSQRTALVQAAKEDLFSEFGALMAAAVFNQPERYAEVETNISALSAHVGSLANLVPPRDRLSGDVREIQERIASSEPDTAEVIRIARSEGLGPASARALDVDLAGQITDLMESLDRTAAAEQSLLQASQAADRGASHEMVRVLAIIAAAWLMIVLLAVVLIHQLFVRPLMRVSNAARAIAGGATENRAPTPVLRELAEVGDAINSLTDSLMERSKQVEDFLSTNLEQRTAELEALFDSTYEAMVLLDPTLHIRAFNQAAAAFAKDLMGVELSAGLLIVPAFRETFGDEALSRAMQAVSGERVEFEREFIDSGGRHRWFDVSCGTIRSDDGSVLGIAFVARDATAGRMVEQQLIQAQKMESVGRLAGGVAHDFNNLLTAMMGYHALAAAELPEDSQARLDIAESTKAATKAAVLTRQLLAFARRQLVSPQDVDLNVVVRDMEKLLGRLLGEDVALVTALASEPLVAHVDPGQFEQVIVNLAVNARDAMPDGGTLTIESGAVTLDASYAEARVDIVQGLYALVAVSDTGCGIPAEILGKIFEPFFTTKDVGKGTGLGLATCYGIVKQASGHMTVYSEPGNGTSFKIYLPLSAGRQVEEQPTNVISASESGSESILLVEDQDEVRELVERVLRSAGYNVRSAPEPMKALEIAAKLRSFDLIITDLIMPGMDGLALIDMLTGLLGPKPVLLMSGYAEEATISRATSREGVEFVPKPISPDELLEKVRNVLATRKPSV